MWDSDTQVLTLSNQNIMIWIGIGIVSVLLLIRSRRNPQQGAGGFVFPGIGVGQEPKRGVPLWLVLGFAILVIWLIGR